MRGWFVLLFAGCLPPSDDTGGFSPVQETSVQAFSGDCVTVERFEASATVLGAGVDRAVLDLWDSGVPQGWHEAHPFAAASTDESPVTTDTGLVDVTTSLEMALTYTYTQADVGDSAPGVGRTWLSCQPNGVFDLGLVTYALRAYGDGELLTCSTFGFDPSSVSGGTYSIYGGQPASPAELLDCEHGTF